jgi:8-oxo-dGTP pyrophosphatase MutT (NUDIX family)
MVIATLRPAATVVVARESSGRAGFELLMVRRNDRVAFMAGAYVFPGGRVDDTDVAEAEGDPARAFRLAAARELHEEAAVRVNPADLILFAHWVTPEIETRRYDTRFFLASMPPGQEPRHDASETTEFAWLTPHEAIERCLGGDILLPPPTWTTLKRLKRHGTLEELFAWARSVVMIPAVQPRLSKNEGQTLLMLPGDPTYPPIEGWEVPEDTRFVLRDGRWLPVSPKG